MLGILTHSVVRGARAGVAVCFGLAAGCLVHVACATAGLSAIVPQFIDPARGDVGTQALVLGLVSIVSGTAVNLVTAVLGARARRLLLARERGFTRLQRLAGGALIAMGVRVAPDRAR